MTTKVTIDAHAGWDVEYKTVALDSTGNVDPNSEFTFVVSKNTVKDVYIHSHMQIISIKELRGD